MIDSVMLWNEPNNKSHWDPEIDPDWLLFAEMVKEAAHAVRDANPHLTRVLGGISPIDPVFIRKMEARGVLDAVDAVAVHGFPLDWNLWSIHDWPAKLDEIRAVTDLPVWVSEVGVSTFARHTPEIGLCQWFHFEDHRLEEAVAWMKRLGVRYLRTGLSWADSFRPGALDWFDRQMAALQDFDVTVTFCFTPEHRGISPHHTSAPLVRAEFAEFCAAMVRRYAPASAGIVPPDRVSV
jgi:beta-xylosidase